MQAYQKIQELPLTESQVSEVQSAIIDEARRTLIGRRFLDLFGPLGAGVETVSCDTYQKDSTAEIHLEGKPDPDPIGAHTDEQYMRIPLIYKDFLLHWRDIKWSADMGAPLDAGNAVLAAHNVAHREDDLIFTGWEDGGLEGLANARGSTRLPISDWSQVGSAFRDVLQAILELQKGNHHAPYALALSLDLYSLLLKNAPDAIVLEVEQLQKLCEDGVHYTHSLPEQTAVLVSTGRQNFDVAVAEDLNLAYLGPQNMNHLFRVYESLTLRIKRPSAICVLTPNA